MKRPAPPPPPKSLPLRKWLLPVIALLLVFSIFKDRSFDKADLVTDFTAGRVEDALQRLDDTRGVGLPPDISRLDWFSRETRAPELSRLLATPVDELLESPDHPTFVSPLDSYREEPERAELREGWPTPLVFELTHLDLGLDAMRAAVPPGTTEIRFDVPLIPGASYQMALREVGADGGDGPIVALARFDWASAELAQRVGLAMATAHDLAVPSHEGSALLAAIAAFGYGYTDEAFNRLEELEGVSEYAQVCRELKALVLSRQGLDWSARELLRR